MFFKQKRKKESKYTVDCITASGVFKINVLYNGTVLHGEGMDLPWIYILPSSVSYKNYLRMITDLIDLNEKLVMKEHSSVGVGADSLSYTLLRDLFLLIALPITFC